MKRTDAGDAQSPEDAFTAQARGRNPAGASEARGSATQG